MNDALFELIGLALELMHKPFLVPGSPRSAELEFYHQFRKLWDRGIPVGMGLGHILLTPAGEGFIVVRLAENNRRAENLASITFGDAVVPLAECRDHIRIAYTGDRWQVSDPSSSP